MKLVGWLWIAGAASVVLGIATSTLESWSKFGDTYMGVVLRHQRGVLLTVAPLLLYVLVCLWSGQWNKFLFGEAIWLTALSLFVKASHSLSCGFGVKSSTPVNPQRVAFLSAVTLVGVLVSLPMAILVFIYEPENVALLVGGVVALAIAGFLYYVLASLVGLHRAGYVSKGVTP
ncbi:hypothetical protein [Geoalkalibacter halelectricus]|uniref:hypothetical protein n=1 Tax=Geoalkalibacter halelectricus TaxID=2847045 RepID=UPI0026708A70|nr:hypothetical protein [Geoalkalibacter halelectricus]MDO3380470.1 hypothetical protein [Geoalkalibacter halelectricus]